MRTLYPLLFIASLSVHAEAQTQKAKSTDAGIYIQTGLSTLTPLGDWKRTYASGMVFALDPGYKTEKQWTVGLLGRALYGMPVRIEEQILGFLETVDNQILGLSGSYAEVRTEGRGTQLGVYLGKIFPKTGLNPLSGIECRIGGGWMQHRIVFTNPEASVPLVNKPYSDGFDRLHQGAFWEQSIGYFHRDPKGSIHYQLGLDLFQARTVSARGYNYDTRLPDTEKKWDLGWQIRATWYLPLFKSSQPKTGPRFYVD